MGRYVSRSLDKYFKLFMSEFRRVLVAQMVGMQVFKDLMVKVDCAIDRRGSPNVTAYAWRRLIQVRGVLGVLKHEIRTEIGYLDIGSYNRVHTEATVASQSAK